MARKYYPKPAECSTIPGSLEENLEQPENFLNVQHKPNITLSETVNSSSLSPINVYEQSHINKLYDGVNCPKIIRKLTRLSLLDEMNLKSKITYTDDEHIDSKIKFPTRNKFELTMKNFHNLKQERHFDVYRTLQRNSQKVLKQICNDIGRNTSESIVTKSLTFRQKMEKFMLSESKNLDSNKNIDKKWYLGLRNTPEFNDMNHYGVKVGNSYTCGLWMKVIGDKNSDHEIIRMPEIPNNTNKSFNYKEKLHETKSYKNISELVVIY